MKNNDICVFQLSDTHQFAKINEKLMGLNTHHSFDAVVKLIHQTADANEAPFLVLTGDLSQDGSVLSYQRIVETLKNFPGEIAWIPGNHDDDLNMATVFNASRFSSKKHFILNNWQVILLNSHKKGEDAGFLTEDQCHFLISTLSKHPNHALIMLHHHILPTGAKWLDHINLTNHQDFLDIIDQFAQVKVVACGHVHQLSEQTRRKVFYCTAPSTCFQFKPKAPDFLLDDVMPGFNIIHLHSDGRASMSVKRIPFHKAFVPDMTLDGY